MSTTAENWWGRNGIAQRLGDHVRISVLAVAAAAALGTAAGGVARPPPSRWRRSPPRSSTSARPCRASPSSRSRCRCRCGTASASGSGRRSSPSSPSALPPIFTNTYAGVAGVDPAVVQAARGMGLREARGAAAGRGAERPAADAHGAAVVCGAGRGHGYVGGLRRLRRSWGRSSTKAFVSRTTASSSPAPCSSLSSPSSPSSPSASRNARSPPGSGRGIDENTNPPRGRRAAPAVRPRGAACGDDDDDADTTDTTAASGGDDTTTTAGDGGGEGEGCAASPAPDGAPEVTIGAQDFGESAILAEIYSQCLEAAGYTVVDPGARRLP